MPFSSLVGNERVKSLLKRTVAEGRTAQGLILAGQAGVGKHQFALALAQAVNCERPIAGDACGVCIPCRKVAAGEHLDVATISPDGQFIKVEQMREMARAAQFRPYEGRHRVYIIDKAHRLRDEAANSILKTLEEPPDTTTIVLITPRPYALLETIRSRCQMVSFAPLTAAELESYLKANFKRPPEETRMLARLARGSIGRALEIDLGEYKEKRASVMVIVEALAVTRDTVQLMGAAESLGRKLERDEFQERLDILLIILSDIFHLKLGQSAEQLTNADMEKRLTRAAEACSLDQIMDWTERIEAVLRGLTRNVNRQLSIESAFVAS